MPSESLKRLLLSRLSPDRRHFYHLTAERWGDSKRLAPLPSNHPKIIGRGADEPEISRICVAPTPAQCLAAIYWYIKRERDIYIYRTARPVRSVEPWNIGDVAVTGERWLIRSTLFLEAGVIRPSLWKMIPSCHPADHTEQRMVMERIAQFIKFHEVNC